MSALLGFQVDDGGRALAGFRGSAGDCVTRSIAIATGKPYREVYKALMESAREYAAGHRGRVAERIARTGPTPRGGVFREAYEPYLRSIGWDWTPTMSVGSGCKVHLRADELPPGRLVVVVSKHVTAVIDGVIHDTSRCDREGTRCVYGFYRNREGT